MQFINKQASARYVFKEIKPRTMIGRVRSILKLSLDETEFKLISSF